MMKRPKSCSISTASLKHPGSQLKWTSQVLKFCLIAICNDDTKKKMFFFSMTMMLFEWHP